VEGSCEHGNEPSGCIKCWENFEYLRDLLLFKKGSAPRSYLIISTIFVHLIYCVI
jgi:hypothetical protein